MLRGIRAGLFFLLLFLCPDSHVLGQADIPVATISHTEDYRSYPTHPNVCFRDAWFDDAGRLWLLSCPQEAYEAMLMFMFDGYEFKLVGGILDSLGPHATIQSRVSDYGVIGWYGRGPLKDNVLYADLETGDLSMIESPFPIGTSRSRVIAVSEDSVHIAALQNNAIALMTWGKSGISSQLIGGPDGQSEIVLTELSEDAVYYIENGPARFYKTSISSSETVRLSLSDEALGLLRSPIISARAYFIEGTPWFKVFTKDGPFVLTYDELTQELKRPDFIPLNPRSFNLFHDKVGNVLFHWKTSRTSHQAVLVRQDGSKVDYSRAFENYGTYDIYSVVGNDFSEEILVCHSRGLWLHRIANPLSIKKALEGVQIRAMVEAANGEIFVTSQRTEQYFLNPRTGVTKSFNQNCHIVRRTLDLFQDDIIGSSRDGLVKINIENGKCETWISELGSCRLFARSGDKIAALTSNSKLFLLDVGADVVTPIGQDGKPIEVQGSSHEMVFYEGFLWIATSAGLLKVNIESGESEIIGKNSHFADSRFQCLHVDRKGIFWLGTAIAGIQKYDPNTGVVETIDSKNGLPNNTVVTIEEDADGDIWAATYDGVALLSSDGDVIRVFNEEDGIANRESNRYSSLVTKSGSVLIGSIKGVSIIDPQAVKAESSGSQNTRINLTRLEYTNGDGIASSVDWFSDLQGQQSVTLPAANRSLTVQCALSSLSTARENRFEYKFEGETDWLSNGTNHILEFKDLSGGDHKLLIRGYDAYGSPSSNQIEIDIRVQRFLYQNWWFYVLCGLVVVGLIFVWISRLRIAVNRATATIEEDKQIIEEQAEKLKALDDAKSRFFTNISHEFRTPLTVISGMASQIEEDPNTWAHKGSQLIQKNSSRLLKLVNQILDLRKLEGSNITFNMVQGNVVTYLAYLADTFMSYTQSQGIEFTFIPHEETIEMDYDPDKLAEIVTNLVSNAIKFCSTGDQIQLEVLRSAENDTCVIQVTDSGQGIPEEELPYIFERFFQASTGDDSVEGSGIGLALVSELIARLKGDISVDSKLHEGSSFTVSLPIERKSSVQHNVEHAGIESKGDVRSEVHITTSSSLASATLLLVEDNRDLVIYMQSILSDSYHIQVAQDGIAGQNAAFELVPDIVISDLMMPGQTGLELCQALKTDLRTDHIPFILLTAKADQETRVEGLQAGADAFLTKPFDKNELLAVIENLLEQRRLLQSKFLSTKSALDETNVAEPINPFIVKLNEVIEENIDDEDFTVVHLCRAMTLGRSQLHKKIKALTGRSTTGYIRYRRLLRSKELLAQGDMNVSEVAFAVGFNSLNYFSRSFIKEFGVPPSQA